VTLPLRWRLTAWYAGMLTAIVVLLGVFLVHQLRAALVDSLDAELAAGAAAVAAAVLDDADDPFVARGLDGDDHEDFDAAAQATLPSASGVVQLVDRQGTVLAQYGQVVRQRAVVPAALREQALAGSPVRLTAPVEAGGAPYRLRVSALPGPDGGVLVIALNLQRVDDDVRQLLLLLSLAGPAALAATVLAGYAMARKALRPVERMTRDAQDIDSERLSERVAVPATRDEIGLLAVTLNAMLDRIESEVERQRQLVADASHELRTPLAVMRTELDVSLRADDLPPAAQDVLLSTREEVDRMRTTVDNLLTLAAADEGRIELLTLGVSAAEVVEGATRPLQALAAARALRLEATGEPWVAQADPHRLRMVVTNFVTNAIAHSPRGGVVEVSTWAGADEVGITVTDSGPGVPADERERLFDRFYRLDSARGRGAGGSGSGLGLAICREVAAAHGGRVWVDSAPGGGSAFSIALPAWRVLGAASVPAQHEVAAIGLGGPTAASPPPEHP
jgi:heavy metal sensor kinase